MERKSVSQRPVIPTMGVAKYLQLHGDAMHRYTRAYMAEKYRGIMKSKREWDREFLNSMEGSDE